MNKKESSRLNYEDVKNIFEIIKNESDVLLNYFSNENELIINLKRSEILGLKIKCLFDCNIYILVIDIDRFNRNARVKFVYRRCNSEIINWKNDFYAIFKEICEVLDIDYLWDIETSEEDNDKNMFEVIFKEKIEIENELYFIRYN